MGGSIFDTVIANARLRERPEGLWTIAVSDGIIREIARESLNADTAIDAVGNLVTTPFANPHMHLDKVHTLDVVGEDSLRRYSQGGMGEAMAAVELAAKVKEGYAEDWIYENARSALIDGLRHGVLRVRAFADTDTSAGLEGVRALLRLRDEFHGVVDVKVVAFPQDGVVRDPGSAEVVRAALELGADVVGGIPWVEMTDAEAREHVRVMMDLAVEFNRDVAMLVDDAGDPNLRTCEMLAQAAAERQWGGRVSACHARALALYPQPTLRRLLGLASRVDMSFVSNPHTGPLALPIWTLLDAGLTVALGQDDIVDAYYPFGQHSMLEVAFLASHVLHRYTLDDMSHFFDMVTKHAARAMGSQVWELAVGAPADVVILDGDSVHEVLRRHTWPRCVIRAGRVVAENHCVARTSVPVAASPSAPKDS